MSFDLEFLEVLSLWLGHGSALTVHRTVIHSLAAVPFGRAKLHYPHLNCSAQAQTVQLYGVAPKKQHPVGCCFFGGATQI